MPENPYEQADTKNFVSLSPWLLFEMSVLSGNAWRVFALLIRKMERKQNSREPKNKSNPFHLSPIEFEIYGVPKASFKRAMKELNVKKFIREKGRRNKRSCKLLKW